MVIDSSALVAIILGEPLAPALLGAIRAARTRELCSVSLLETGIVLVARLGARSLPSLDKLIEDIDCEIVPFDASQGKAAMAAFARFGKGMGHRAQLNLGDCAVYALAAIRGEPVLATGGDFRATDLSVVAF